MAESPKLSVIVASYESGRTIEACLESLRNQRTDWPFEVIAVDSGTDGAARLIEKRFPEVKLCRSSERKFCGAARNWAMGIARGEIVAFLDADCVARPDWVETLCAAHETVVPVIGGAIANGNPESLVGWAAYFCEFSRWMPGTPPQWLDDIAGANISYKRELFDRYGPFIEGTYCSDTEYHWRLGRDGIRLRFEPSSVVAHRNIERLRQFLGHEFDHGRSFGRVHRSAKGFSFWTRSVKMAGVPLGILRMLAAITANIMKNRTYLPQFVAALPLLMLGVVFWSVGQGVGYVEG
jgi:GT2 family glycosyltransferase